MSNEPAFAHYGEAFAYAFYRATLLGIRQRVLKHTRHGWVTQDLTTPKGAA